MPAQHLAPSRRGLILGTVAALVVLVLVAASLSLAVQSRRREQVTAARLTALGTRSASLQKQLTVVASSTRSLTTRLGTLEAKVNGQPDPSAIAKAAALSVFTVVTDEDTGSGFVVSSDDDSSQLITNYHVIASTFQAGGRTVQITRGKTKYDGHITQTEQAYDLAIIVVERKLPALTVATKPPEVGAPLLVLGSPLGLGGTVTSGIVSAYRTLDGNREMQFSAPISPGNSGGPVLDLKGRVVGVSVAKYEGGGAEGLSFAIPARTLCTILDVC